MASLSLVAAFVASAAGATEFTDLETASCQACHGIRSWQMRDPVTGHIANLSIGSAAYQDSSHGALPCRTCHEWGYDRIPHTGAGDSPIYLCVACHERDHALEPFNLPERKADLRGSVHGTTDAGPLDCHSCHDPHAFLPINDSADALVRIEQSNAVCLRCHGSEPSAAERFAQPDAEPFHEVIPSYAHHLRKVKCVACHSGSGSSTFHDITAKEQAIGDCSQCHTPTSRLLDAVYGPQRPNQEASGAEDAYVIGSTRSPMLELLSQIIFAALVGAIAIHSIARGVRWLRTRRSDDA